MMSLVNRFTIAAVAVSLVACSTADTVATTGAPALVVYGSGSALGASLRMDGDSGAVFGPAGSLTIKLYSLYISTNADCSSPQLVQDLGAAGVNKDFMTNPVLFEGTPTAGTYQCVMMKMSDVLNMKPGAAVVLPGQIILATSTAPARATGSIRTSRRLSARAPTRCRLMITSPSS